MTDSPGNARVTCSGRDIRRSIALRLAHQGFNLVVHGNRDREAVLYEQGKPRPYARCHPLVIEELDLAAPGPDEALVEVRAAGLSHCDLSSIEGIRKRALPRVVGHELTGETGCVESPP